MVCFARVLLLAPAPYWNQPKETRDTQAGEVRRSRSKEEARLSLEMPMQGTGTALIKPQLHSPQVNNPKAYSFNNRRGDSKRPMQGA